MGNSVKDELSELETKYRELKNELEKGRFDLQKKQHEREELARRYKELGLECKELEQKLTLIYEDDEKIEREIYNLKTRNDIY